MAIDARLHPTIEQCEGKVDDVMNLLFNNAIVTGSADQIKWALVKQLPDWHGDGIIVFLSSNGL